MARPDGLMASEAFSPLQPPSFAFFRMFHHWLVKPNRLKEITYWNGRVVTDGFKNGRCHMLITVLNIHIAQR